MTLRLGVDATAWWNPRGDGRFARNAIRALVADGGDWTLVSDRVLEGVPGARVRVAPVTGGPARAGAARGPVDLLRLRRATRGLDAFLSPSVYSWFPTAGVPSVVGVHDANSVTLAPLVLPGRRDRLLWRLKLAAALRSATRVFTLSEASRVALVEHLSLDPSRVAVVTLAPEPVFAPQPEDVVASSLAAVGVEPPFIVYAAGLSPHKGLDTLLDALDADTQLVLVGDLDDDLYASDAARVRARAASLRVVLPGHVSDQTLAALYTAATAAVVPSRGEGFGLPAVEAAACGAACVLSDIPPHRETLGDAAVFFPPGDASALASALRRVVDDAGLRDDVAARGRSAVARLTWEETARRLRVLLEEAAAS